MPKKQIIAIDVDDVLAHSVEAFRLQVNERVGVRLTPEHYMIPGEYHQYLNRVLEGNGVDYSPIKDELFQKMVEDQSHISPQPGAGGVLEKLADDYDFVVITARAPEWQPETIRWLARHFPDVFRAVHFAGNRHDPTLKTKGDMCRELGATYLIDDNPEHVLDARDKGIKAILFGDYCWHIDVPDGIVRCKTWLDVEEYFDGKRG